MSQKNDRIVHLVLLGTAILLIVLFLILGAMKPIRQTGGVIGEVGRLQHKIQDVEHTLHDAIPPPSRDTRDAAPAVPEEAPPPPAASQPGTVPQPAATPTATPDATPDTATPPTHGTPSTTAPAPTRPAPIHRVVDHAAQTLATPRRAVVLEETSTPLPDSALPGRYQLLRHPSGVPLSLDTKHGTLYLLRNEAWFSAGSADAATAAPGLFSIHADDATESVLIHNTASGRLWRVTLRQDDAGRVDAAIWREVGLGTGSGSPRQDGSTGDASP